jgi:putative ABC transport system permease protein
MRPLFVLRWSARDLRRRWLQVTAIALIIAVGTGVYSALGSTATWRQQSNDASFDLLAMYDVRVKAAEGADAPEGSMLSVLDRLQAPDVIAQAEERLVGPTQVDASTDGKTILVPGRVIGVDVHDAGPQVNKIWVAPGQGRTLALADQAGRTVVLERNFASFYGLPATGSLRVGGQAVNYVGTGLSPEYFLVVTEEGGFFAQANFAAIFAPLDMAQALIGRPGRVNDLVLRIRPGVDLHAVVSDLEHAFSGAGLAVTVMERRDEDAFRLLYDDIDGDQKFWNVFAALILAGAGFGAFNLASRMVEAQRREIGVGMALGASPRELALRPLLVGVEIAVLGVAFGLGMGLLAMAAIRPVYTSMLPLPVWHTDFQPSMFLRGAALGFVLPVIATAWPVWRAVRVTPVNAITTTHRSVHGGLSPLLRRLRWPRSTYARMPIGNVLRTPRRTLLTAMGIGAAVTALIATLGMIDSFLDTMSRHDRELLRDHADRVAVSLQGFHQTDAPEIAAIAAQPSVGAVQPVLRFGGRLAADGKEAVDVFVYVIDLDGEVWAPTLVQGGLPPDRAGLVISREAASDLGIGPGSVVTLEHPAPRGAGLELVQDQIMVVAVHPSPFRFAAYIDRSQLAALGVPDIVNQLFVLPAAGFTPQDVQRALFGLPQVASVQPVSASSKVLQDSLDEFVGVFRVLELFIFLLALLIAYNATSINTDERAREHATLFAFGLPLRRVLRMDVVEGLVIGLLGTVVGIIAGAAVLQWITTALVGNTMPEIGLDVAISGDTIITALILGVVAVAVAPLLTIRKARRMNIPSTLRVVE